jgi:hypothetical protein
VNQIEPLFDSLNERVHDAVRVEGQPSPRNVELVDRRLRETLRVLNRHQAGDTTVWTVEPAPVTELVATTAGQLGLWA